MSRWKRFAIGTIGTLAVLSGATTVWYQSHYVVPLAPPPTQTLPSPNGFDTLKEALRLQEGPVHWVPAQGWEKQPLAERQKLLARNQPFLAKTREALTQEYCIPRRIAHTPGGTNTEFLNSHLGQLIFAAQTYADSGNVPDAMRCALDSLELGVIVPRGGDFNARDTGSSYEAYGQEIAWKLVAQVDASAAREAVTRLEKMEKRRWPLPESLREELQQGSVARTLSVFRGGAIYAWEMLRLKRADEAKRPEDRKGTRTSDLWSLAREVYGGPKGVIDTNADYVKQAQEHFAAPWNPDRPGLVFKGPASFHVYYGYIPTYADYSSMEWVEFFYRTQAALLRVHLALRAYSLERGSYPNSLDTLVETGYLKAVPGDPFSPTRAPLRYKPSGTAFTLWSVGPDGIDDGGRASLAKRRQSTGRFPSCDVVGGDRRLMMISSLP